jgi:DNA-binding protein HU-beta
MTVVWEVEDDADSNDGLPSRQDSVSASDRQRSALDELNELVTRQLKKEGLLSFAGLGVFRKRKLKARMGRHPATGERIKIPARTRLRFTLAKALKASVLGAR